MGVMLRGIFEHERLKPAIIRTNQGNVNNLAELKQVYEHRIKIGTTISTFCQKGQDIIVFISIVQACR